MLKKLAESNAARSGLVLVLAAVIVLAHISQVSSQQQGAGKTKAVSYTQLTLPTKA